MERWTKIMQMPATPEKRLSSLMELLSHFYNDYHLFYFDSDNKINIEPNAKAIDIHMRSSSILGDGTKNTSPSAMPDPIIQQIMKKEHDCRLVNSLASKFNSSLNKQQRGIIKYKVFYQLKKDEALRMLGVSEYTYYKSFKIISSILIMEFGLDYYDADGILIGNWEEIINRRINILGYIRTKDMLPVLHSIK